MKGILITTACLCMVIVLGFFALSFLLRHKAGQHPSYQDMKAQAASAIRQVGGVEVLEKEAKYLLEHFGTQPGNWRRVDGDEEKNCQSIAKLRLLLTSPHGMSDFWTSGGNLEEGVPAHVEVRFGTHFYYLYLWIYDGAHLPSRQIEGLEHLNGTVYLSTRRT